MSMQSITFLVIVNNFMIFIDVMLPMFLCTYLYNDKAYATSNVKTYGVYCKQEPFLFTDNKFQGFEVTFKTKSIKLFNNIFIILMVCVNISLDFYWTVTVSYITAVCYALYYAIVLHNVWNLEPPQKREHCNMCHT